MGSFSILLTAHVTGRSANAGCSLSVSDGPLGRGNGNLESMLSVTETVLNVK